MASVQFISYNLSFLLTVAHFLDSCKEQEWNEPIFFNSYPLWLIITTIFLGILQCGIIPAYIGNKTGNYFSIFACPLWTRCWWISYSSSFIRKIKCL